MQKIVAAAEEAAPEEAQEGWMAATAAHAVYKAAKLPKQDNTDPTATEMVKAAMEVVKVTVAKFYEVLASERLGGDQRGAWARPRLLQ